jgi:hypothetical protein
MKQFILAIIFLYSFFNLSAQSINKIIKEKEVKRIEQFLSADDMQGRQTFTKGIEKASAFIEGEFSKIGLQTFNDAANFRQEFYMYESKTQEINLIIDGKGIQDSMVACFTYAPEINFTEKSDIEVVKINKGEKFGPKFYQYYQSKKNLLVLVDTAFSTQMKSVKRMEKMSDEPGKNAIVFVLDNSTANTFTIAITTQLIKKPLNNVVGVLKGKTKPDEYVVFSGHYDHLGIRNADKAESSDGRDSIYNGANDDAAGTTAVIMLAKYFKKLNNNERTIIFTAFTAEEIGGFGSKYFSKQLAPEKVMAMFNIEMIGTNSKWGNNSAYITGFEKTDLGTILQKNLEGSAFNFYPDPYPDQQLFYRSDNATLARLGVPAHTISTSKMDNEPNYHQVSDEIRTLDIKNMTAIIKAIAISSVSIVNGMDTPTRVDAAKLK